MKSIIVAALAAMASLTAAAPSKRQQYKLKTVAVDGDKFDGLFVSTYHTFAGGNIAQLVENPKNAVPMYLKNDFVYFDLGKGPDSQYPLQISQSDTSAAWGEISINIVDKPLGKFIIKHDHLIYKSKYLHRALKDFDKGASWRVCGWTHGVPELFLNFPLTSDNIHRRFNPTNCALVNLKAVPVD